MAQMIKALSVRQPWANLIANGSKTIETRTWATHYRGELLIVSSKKPAIYPAGYALAIVRLSNCRPMTVEDEPRAMCDLYDGAYAWVLDGVWRLDPVPVNGTLGLYDVDTEVFYQRQ